MSELTKNGTKEANVVADPTINDKAEMVDITKSEHVPPNISIQDYSGIDVSCRCGCVPANMLSLFQMAELRAKRKARMKKEAEEAARLATA